MTGLKIMTAGTFETRFDRRVAKIAMMGSRSGRKRWATAKSDSFEQGFLHASHDDAKAGLEGDGHAGRY